MSTLYSDQWATVYHADAAKVAEILPPKSVHACVTSPPYFGLRNYLAAEDTHKAHEMGAEESPEEYVAALVEVFRGVWKVLRDDGTAWLNLGDSYAANRGSGNSLLVGNKQASNSGSLLGKLRVPEGRKPKDLIGIPWLVAFALQQDGWYLRSDIIWAKDSCMPESVSDRPTKAHEYVYLLTKQPRYFYDAEAIKEPGSDWGPRDRSQSRHNTDLFRGVGQPPHAGLTNGDASAGRNKRSVWRVNPKPYSGAHFATFPPALIEPCIKAGTSEHGVCESCGAPWKRVLGEREQVEGRGSGNGFQRPQRLSVNGRGAEEPWVPTTRKTVDWQPTCSCNADTIPATVLDPFMGSGTTAHTARRLGRRSVGLELDSKCSDLIHERMGLQEVLL